MTANTVVKRAGNLWRLEWLSASQEGLCSMVLVKNMTRDWKSVNIHTIF